MINCLLTIGLRKGRQTTDQPIELGSDCQRVAHCGNDPAQVIHDGGTTNVRSYRTGPT